VFVAVLSSGKERGVLFAEASRATLAVLTLTSPNRESRGFASPFVAASLLSPLTALDWEANQRSRDGFTTWHRIAEGGASLCSVFAYGCAGQRVTLANSILHPRSQHLTTSPIKELLEQAGLSARLHPCLLTGGFLTLAQTLGTAALATPEASRAALEAPPPRPSLQPPCPPSCMYTHVRRHFPALVPCTPTKITGPDPKSS
jgi:hypothetical protein